MRRALEALIRFYETGEDADRVAYDIAWVADKESPVDTINGFIENYLDARGVKGAWEALVYFVNQREDRGHCSGWRTPRAWFEERMPWDPQWRRTGRRRRHRPRDRRRRRNRRVRPGDADRHQPAERSGDSRSSTAASPCRSPTSLRRTSKSQPPSYRREFCWSRGGGGARGKMGRAGRRSDDGDSRSAGPRIGPRGRAHLNGQPQLALKEQYSALEESRADLVALYFMREPKIAEDRAACRPSIRTRSCRPSTRRTRATRWCSCAASARARRSRKITCAIARRSCTG